ncbi:MAG: sugar phosphate isomerase/epimerase family protein [Aggregatilineales bacterium]
MDNHWNAYCALSLVHFLAFPECQSGDGPILETVAQVAHDDFFSAIEISRINDSTIRMQVARLIEQSHMRVAFGAQPIILSGKLNLNSPDPSERQRSVETLKTYIPAAAEIGAKQFVILSGPDPVESERSLATHILIDSILQLCAYGRVHGIRITLETFDRTVDKKALIGPAVEAAALAVKVKADFPDFGILYDMGHMPLLDESPRPALNELKEHLVHAHVGNCVKVSGRPSYGDLHPRFGFPGSENDAPQLIEFLRVLFDVGYLREDPPLGARPWVGFEMRPQAGESSTTILANMKRTWNEAWWEV